MRRKIFYQNKVVIITGSTMGIGKELAKNILALGGKVVLTGRNIERIEALKIELKKYEDSFLIFNGDVISYEDNQRLVQETVNHFGRIDLLITNAGLSCYGEVENLNEGVVKSVIDANIYGSIFPVMAALSELIKSKGSILFISSVAAFQGIPSYSCYCLSKMALTSLSQSLRIELSRKNVYVGIAFVGITENELDKRTLSPEGILEAVPPRSKLFTTSRIQTVKKILYQISRKKKIKVHSKIGRLSYKMNLLFPSLTHRMLHLNYKVKA